MTMTQIEHINCPKCETSHNVQIWQTVNVTNDPDLKKKLLDGEINIFKCDSCDFESYIPIPLLYHDMELKYCVQLVPFDIAVEDDFLQNYDSEAQLTGVMSQMKQFTPYLAKPHIVFNMQELILYILFRDKLAEFHQNGEKTS
jgi:hypothetical protein